MPLDEYDEIEFGAATKDGDGKITHTIRSIQARTRPPRDEASQDFVRTSPFPNGAGE